MGELFSLLEEIAGKRTYFSYAKIIRDRNNQNILALLYLLGSSRPVGFPQVSMQDFDRINLEMDVGETPTLLEVK